MAGADVLPAAAGGGGGGGPPARTKKGRQLGDPTEVRPTALTCAM